MASINQIELEQSAHAFEDCLVVCSFRKRRRDGAERRREIAPARNCNPNTSVVNSLMCEYIVCVQIYQFIHGCIKFDLRAQSPFAWIRYCSDVVSLPYG